MPERADPATTRRQESWVPATAAVKYGAVTSETRPGFSAYASVMRFRKTARMMHPPRQIFATSPFLMSQPYCSAPATIASKPWL